MKVVTLTTYDHSSLQNLVYEAARLAKSVCHSVVMSLVQKIDNQDPLAVFESFATIQSGERFFWQQREQQKALVGAGTVTAITTSGSCQFSVAEQAWHILSKNALIAYAPNTPALSSRGPLLFGGFTFDPLAPTTSLWSGFADGSLVLPHLLFQQEQEQTTLTISILVHAEDDTQDVASNLLWESQKTKIGLEKLAYQKPDFAEYKQKQFSTSTTMPPHEWRELVVKAVQLIKQEEAYRKIVLARSVQAVSSDGAFNEASLLSDLRQNYPEASVFAVERHEKIFVGATPEKLISSSKGELQAMALAGSAPRGQCGEEDKRFEAMLVHDTKTLEEHTLVVETIRQILTSLCAQVNYSDTPHVLQLKNIQHLRTSISGSLLPGKSFLQALHHLHPTPAVGGIPDEGAIAFIRDHEKLDRGWYAGPIGWLDLEGNGEFVVALRSALLQGDTATLFAGCGIVSDSEPESEYLESCLKLNVILNALGEETSRSPIH
jgi:isochorismate synthase